MVDNLNLRPQLERALPALGLSLSEAQVGALMDYLALIQKWTKVYNLTAVRDPDEMLTHHLLDSLAVINPLQKQLAALAARPRCVGVCWMWVQVPDCPAS